MIEKYTILKINKYIPSFLLHIYSLLIVVTGWGIFYFTDFNQMVYFFKVYVGAAGSFTDFMTSTVIFDHFYLWIIAILFCMPLRQWTNTLTLKITKGENATYRNLVLVSRLTLTIVIVACATVLLVGATNNPFLYTRF